MTKEILIEARGEAKRVAVLEDGRLMEIYYENPEREGLLGNIYKGVVGGVLSGLGSAFVDIGHRKPVFLSGQELDREFLRSRGIKSYESFPIGKVLQSGQSVIVQIKREGIKSKNPQGTMKISLPGRYWVFLPHDSRIRVSRRIGDEREIKRLRKIARELKTKIPKAGLIARTASRHAPREELERDFKQLYEVWKGIEADSLKAKAPQLLYKSSDLLKSVVRDRLLKDVAKVVVDSEEAYMRLVSSLEQMQMAEYQSKLELYQGERPLFDLKDVERQIRESLGRKVSLAGGGSLVIEETEALTAIDVNTGSDIRHRDQEKAILNTNLQAAVEIPRQLRLRKISGIIIIDFAGMKHKEHVRKVIRKLKEELKKDRVPADFIDVTELGLVEITRKREGESLADMLGDEVPEA